MSKVEQPVPKMADGRPIPKPSPPPAPPAKSGAQTLMGLPIIEVEFDFPEIKFGWS